MSYKTLPYLPTLPPSEQFTVQEALLLPKQDIDCNNLLWDVTTAPVLEFFQSHLSSAYNLQQCLFFFLHTPYHLKSSIILRMKTLLFTISNAIHKKKSQNHSTYLSGRGLILLHASVR